MNNVANLVKPCVPDLLSLTEQYVIAQSHLKIAQNILAEAESALLSAVGHKPEGSFTVNVGDFKVTTTGKINRTINAEIWEQIKAQIPPALAGRLIKQSKPELSLTEFRYIELNEPAYMALISKAITAKPAKPSISVKTA
jgi:hypothetical protein